MKTAGAIVIKTLIVHNAPGEKDIKACIKPGRILL